MPIYFGRRAHLTLLLLLVFFSGYGARMRVFGCTAVDGRTEPRGTPKVGKAPSVIAIAVDASDAPRRIFHARLTIPVSPGPLTLSYPKWIPGEHMSSGPINNLAGLRVTAGSTLAWQRDLLDMYSFHIAVPGAINSIEICIDYLAPITFDSYYSGSPSTAQLAVINWNEMLLYPKGSNVDELRISASLRLPAGWKFATALPVISQSGDEIRFAAVSLAALIDSPLLTGANFRIVPLLPDDAVRHEIDIASDNAAGVNMSSELIAHFENVVKQGSMLFGARHYSNYHFLLTVSDLVPHGGLEHSESDDSRIPEQALTDPDRFILDAGLLPHEFVHSWNGKYRRPAGEATVDYQQPVTTELIWVYEGLTSYLGDLLTARSGLWSTDQYRNALAVIAADLDHLPGRSWRDLQDSSNAAQVLFVGQPQWTSWRRGWRDFYDEGELVWLWVDVIMRQKSHGQRSLDDFCRLFFGGRDSPPEVRPYDFDDLVRALENVVPYDWRGFLLDRLGSHGPRAPLGGIEDGGWHLVYSDVPSEMLQAREKSSKSINAIYSIGLELKEDGTILDAVEGMAAARAGIGPGMRVVAVNGRHFSADVLHAALRGGKNSSTALELLIENSEQYSAYRLDYYEGEKYPHLQRNSGQPDLLGQIIQPLKTSLDTPF